MTNKIKNLKEGCKERFSEKQGWVGRPYKYPCIKGHLCLECEEKLKEEKL